MMRTKLCIGAAIFAIIFAAIFCVRLWQPEHQALLHTEHLLNAAGNRDWRKVAAFLDDSYTDRWGHDKASAISDARTALQQFFSLRLASDPGVPLTIHLNGERAEVTMRLKMEGSGTAFAQEVKRSINSLRAPFTFEWRRKSWKPWDWQLVRADNAELQIDKNTGR